MKMKLVVEVPIEFELENETKVFNVKVRRVTKKDNKKFKKWAENKEKEFKNATDIAKKVAKLEDELSEKIAELEDLSFEISVTEDKDVALALVKERRELRAEIKKLKTEIEKAQLELDKYEEDFKKLQEEIVQKSWEFRVIQNDEAKALLEFAKEVGVEISELLSTLNRLAKKKFEGK
jgi:chromosome segregation ATPase